MSRFPTTTRRGLLAAVLPVVMVALVAGCGSVQDRLDADDRESFIDASNGLVAAFEELDARYIALGSGELEMPEFVDAARQDIAAMEAQADELEELVADVTGDAAEIAEAAVVAAREVVDATKEIVAAIGAGDPDALEQGIATGDAAVAAFNEQVAAWNEL